jgi:hypothetical protein
MFVVPVIDLGANPVAFFQQGPVFRPKVVYQPGEARPEISRVYTRARDDFIVDQSIKFPCNRQSTAVNPASHFQTFLTWFRVNRQSCWLA